MIRLMPEIEDMLLELLGLHDPRDPLAFSQKKITSLGVQLYRLSRRYILTGSNTDNYHDAYLAYNFPTNFMKSWMIIRWILHRFPRCFAGKKGIQVLDIGCGQGAGMFGTYCALKKDKKISLTGIDQSATVLKTCQKIAFRLKKGDRRLRVRFYRHQFQNALLLKTRKKFDIIILANTLTEIVQEEKIPQKYIEQIFRYVTDDGIVVIIEPASRNLSRRLMRLRDVLLQDKVHHILLPCLHDNICPLIAARKGKEWCHQSRAWRPPPYIKTLNKTLHREIDRLKFSYLVLSKKEYRTSTRTDFLVVSDMLKEKGRRKCYLCTPAGRVELVRLDKSTTPANQDFDSISRGDIVTLRNHKRVRQNSWRIDETGSVTIMSDKTCESVID
jgi:ribosomal protein RSM22 (predicted rRNA methylase)